LDVTLARIRAIVGEDNVGRIILRDTHEPDAFRVEPFTVTAEQACARIAIFPRAAVRRLRPAEDLQVTLREQRPIAFVWRDTRYTVERAYGPWLTSGEWWTSSLWNLEQWDLIARLAGRLAIGLLRSP
jgi:protein ImuB